MNRIILFVIAIIISTEGLGQNLEQKGVVKTRGRMVNGKLVPGKGLPEAMVYLDNNRKMMSAGNNGFFSFIVSGNKYSVVKVEKKGYQLVDAQMCRNYQYSVNPLYLVMETPEQQQADQLAKERRLRRDLEKRIQQREDEIDALNVSLDEKNRLLQDLKRQREDNEKIVKDLSQYYSTLDYDQLDAFQQQVSECLENGEIEKADSLLRSRGDMRSRIASLKAEQEAEAKEAEELAQRQKDLDVSIAGTRKNMEAIATDCYNFHLRFLQAQQYDSVSYYLNLRAELDTTNIKYLIESIDFEKEFIELGDQLDKYRHALEISKKIYGEQSLEYALCCNRIGEEYSEFSYKEADLAEEYLDIALNIFDGSLGDNHLEKARCYLSYGKMYRALLNGIGDDDSDYELAKEYLLKAIQTYNNENPQEYIDIAKCYMLLYDICREEEFSEKALKILKSINKGENAGIAYFYYQKGEHYYENKFILTPSSLGYFFENISDFDDHTAIRKEIQKYKNSIPYFRKSQLVYKNLYGEKYPKVSEINYFIKQIEGEINKLNQALKYKEPFKVLYEIWYD